MNFKASLTLSQLVESNHSYANVLYHFGIPFYRFPNQSLEKVCATEKVDLGKVMHMLESFGNGLTEKEKLDQLPVDLVLAYLRQTHTRFLKHKVPFLSDLIQNLPRAEKGVVADLQLIFPDFVQELISHVHEEEETLFAYVESLHAFKEEELADGYMYFLMEEYNIHDFASEHFDDDEMAGIRDLTNGYELTGEEDLSIQVLMSELQGFDNDIKTHARLEDDILMPKAMELEVEAKDYFSQVAVWN